MKDGNAMIPWQKVVSILLHNQKYPIHPFGLSMAFLLLQNRPDVVCGRGGTAKQKIERKRKYLQMSIV